MKAIMRKSYGQTEKMLYLETPKPKLTEDKVLIKVHAAGINQADIYLLQGKPFLIRLLLGLFKPKFKTLGSDVSGVVEEVGKDVEGFNVGDEVFGIFVFKQEGGYSEYGLIGPKQITHKPKNVTHSEAASVSMAGVTALHALRLAEVKEGTNVLIYGASGGVGTFMIQIAKYFKAHVTAVVSTRNIDVAKASGADIIIDYKKSKWDQDNKKYDVILACNGNNKLSRYRDALNNDGKLVVSGGSSKNIFGISIQKLFLRKKGNRTFQNFMARIANKDLKLLAELLEKKHIRPHIDKEFLLKDAKEAFEHFINHKTIGKTIIKIVK
ncbi:NAD(P)-dependent alcohol dehydrogenase [Mycoplasmatota bacterium WC30]